MEKQDARSLPAQEQHQLRKQVVRAWKRGQNRKQISRDLGLGYTAVCETVHKYREGGMSALKPGQRGRKVGAKRKLTGEQEGHIRQLIQDQRPEQLKLDFALWNRAAMTQLIQREYGLALAVRTVGDYLKRWGFTPQKPLKRAYEQRPEAVQPGWMSSIQPSRPRRASKEEKFTGATKPPWSTPMCADAPTPREASAPRSRPSRADGKSSP